MRQVGCGWDSADRMPVVVMESVAQAAGVDEADQDQGRCGDGEVPDDLVKKVRARCREPTGFAVSLVHNPIVDEIA